MTQVDEVVRTRDPLLVTVRKAVNADLNQLSAVVARAFDDDPVLNWMVMQDRRRAKRIYDVMDTTLRQQMMRHGHVYTTDGVHGGALWLPPGETKPNFIEQARMFPTVARSVGWRRLRAVMSGFSVIEKKHPKKPHYYLGVLATDPDHQGRSVGTRLMRPVLERCDAEHMPAYLESSKERNVPLYERNGFTVTEELVLPDGGPKIWLMWREPQ